MRLPPPLTVVRARVALQGSRARCYAVAESRCRILERAKGHFMNSPFPGMDPYIEACGLWKDFHHLLVGRICDSLSESLPERYVARAGERSYVELVESEGKEKY